MKFEDALSQMRLGKKITHKHLGENVYLQACRLGLMFDDSPIYDMPISIVKMKGEYQHPDMLPPLSFSQQMDLLNIYPILRDKITYPTINLLLIMSDDWIVLEEIK